MLCVALYMYVIYLYVKYMKKNDTSQFEWWLHPGWKGDGWHRKSIRLPKKDFDQDFAVLFLFIIQRECDNMFIKSERWVQCVCEITVLYFSVFSNINPFFKRPHLIILLYILIISCIIWYGSNLSCFLWFC